MNQNTPNKQLNSQDLIDNHDKPKQGKKRNRQSLLRLRLLLGGFVLFAAIGLVFSVARAAVGDITTVAGGGTNTTAGGPAVDFDLNNGYDTAFDTDGNMYIAAYTRVYKVDTNGLITIFAGTGSSGDGGDGGLATAAQLTSVQKLAVDADGNVYLADRWNNRVRKVDTNGIISTLAGTGAYGYNGDGIAANISQLRHPYDVAVDADGNVYIADFNNSRVRKVDTNGQISTVAGNGTASEGGDGGQATSAQVRPTSVTVDVNGNLYIGTNSKTVRMVDSNGVISTVAGGGIGANGPATNAIVSGPRSTASDSLGNVYILAANGLRIEKVSTDGTITTFAGNGAAGYIGDGGPAAAAQFSYATDLAIDSNDNLYIADPYNLRIRMIDTNGIITTVAGNGTSGFSGDGGAATSAQVSYPLAIAIDSADNIYIADSSNNRIRKIDTNGNISTIAGTGNWGNSGDGGAATSADIGYIQSLAIDSNDNIYLQNNNSVRTINSAGIIDTVAGGNDGWNTLLDGGLATSALLSNARGTAVDSAGNVYIADANNQRIRKVDTNGIITTFAGNGNYGTSGDGGAATAAELQVPQAVAVDSNDNVFIADRDGGQIRKVDTSGIISTFATVQTAFLAIDSADNLYASVGWPDYQVKKIDPAGTVTIFAGNGSYGFSGDNGQATSAQLAEPAGLAIDSNGNVYIADSGNRRIRKVDTNGVITTFAGTGTFDDYVDGQSATSANFNYPQGLAIDNSDNLYVAFNFGRLVAKIDSSTGIVTRVTGQIQCCPNNNTGNGGPAVDAMIVSTEYVMHDGSGNLYLSTTYSDTVRVIDNTGTINAFAGTGNIQFAGDGGAATAAVMSDQLDLAVDGSDNLYIADTVSGRVRQVDSNGIITTIAGNGDPGDGGDGGIATSAQLSGTIKIHVDQTGTVYVAQEDFHRVRAVTTDGMISTFAGTGSDSFAGDGGPATNAAIGGISDIEMDGDGNLFIADTYPNYRIRMVDSNGVISTVAGTGTQGDWNTPHGEGGPALDANLNRIDGLGLDGLGNLYFADYNFVRKIEAVASAGNVAPTAVDNSYNTPEDIAVSGNIIVDDTGEGVDSDPEANPLSVFANSNPAGGTLTVENSGVFTFTPPLDASGVFTFDYSVTDGSAESNTAVVTITVAAANDAPIATDNEYTTIVDTIVSGNVVTDDTGDGVDSDPESDLFNVTTTAPQITANGTVAIQSDGLFFYQPNAGFVGIDTFNYTISDGDLSSSGMVTVTVNPEPPTVVDIPLAEGWNLFGFPLQEDQSVDGALASIDGDYKTVWGYDAADMFPWEGYNVDAPVWANDLQQLKVGRGYWISTTQETTITFSSANSRAAAVAVDSGYRGVLPHPPAAYYGNVGSIEGVSPEAGLVVAAWIDGVLCGQSATQVQDGAVVYAIQILSSDEIAGCGVENAMVSLTVDGAAAATTVWNANDYNPLDIGSSVPSAVTLSEANAERSSMLFVIVVMVGLFAALTIQALRNRGRSQRFFFLVLSVLVGVFFLSSFVLLPNAFAFVPQQPHRIWGEFTVTDAAPGPATWMVTAEANGTPIATFEITSDGTAPTNFVWSIPADDPETGAVEGASLGDTISFSSADGIDVPATFSFVIGAFVEQNLVAYSASSVTVDEDGNVVLDLNPDNPTDVTAVYSPTLMAMIITDANNPITAGDGATQLGPNSIAIPIGDVTGGIVIEGSPLDDTFTADFTNGWPFPPGTPITFSGGDGNDQVLVENVPAGTSVEQTQTDSTSGSIDIGGEIINYTGMESVDIDTPTDSITVNLPDTDDTVTLDLNAGDNELTGTTIGTSEFDAPNVGGSATVNLGDGDDVIIIDAADMMSGTILAINGEGGTDTVNYNATAALGNGPVVVQVSAENVNFDAASTFAPVLGENGNGMIQTTDPTVVSLNGATLNPSLLPGYTPSPGSSWVIIDNQDPSSTVVGQFAGLAEGDTVEINGETMSISYMGGDGNDVVLTLISTASVDDDGNVTLTLNPENPTDVTAVYSPTLMAMIITDANNPITAGDGATQLGPNSIAIPIDDITGGITIEGSDLDDTFTADFSNGWPFPPGTPVTFNGGDGNDEVLIENLPAGTDVEQTQTDDGNGSITIGGETINYNGIGSVDVDTPVDNTTVNLPDTDDTVTLALTNGDNGVSGATVGSTEFDAPEAGGTVTVNLGDGDDVFNIDSADMMSGTVLAINGEGGTDTVNWNATGPIGDGPVVVEISAETVNFDPASTFAPHIGENGNGMIVTTDPTTVNLNGATLDPIFVAGFVPGDGESWVIIDNQDPNSTVNGQFAGLAEGDTIEVNGVTLTITYMGGDGNDVVLIGPNNVVASDNEYTTIVNRSVVGNLLTDDTGDGVDTDADGDALSAEPTGFTSTDNGTVSIGADGTFFYIPNADFIGQDTFTYTATDGLVSDSALVTITVDATPPTVVELPLPVAGWHLFSYPLQQSQTVTDALSSIDGKYNTVWGYDNVTKEWQGFDVDVPEMADLVELEWGGGYWITVTEATTIEFSTANNRSVANTSGPLSLSNSIPNPPSAFYGEVEGVPAGVRMAARVNGMKCAVGYTFDIGGTTHYKLYVSSAEDVPACGFNGATVEFDIDRDIMPQTGTWKLGAFQELDLAPIPTAISLQSQTVASTDYTVLVVAVGLMFVTGLLVKEAVVRR